MVQGDSLIVVHVVPLRLKYQIFSKVGVTPERLNTLHHVSGKQLHGFPLNDYFVPLEFRSSWQLVVDDAVELLGILIGQP